MNIIRSLQGTVRDLQRQLDKPIKVMPASPDFPKGAGQVKPFMPTIQVPDISELVQQAKALVDDDFIEKPRTGLENIFSTSITNSDTVAKTVLLFPGLLIRAGQAALAKYGLSNAVILKEGTQAAGNIKVESDQAPLDILQWYLLENPALLLRIQVASGSPTQNTTAFKVQELTPWSSGDDRHVLPATSLDQYADNEKYVVFPANFVVSEQVAVIYKVEAKTTVKLTFYFGPALNKAQALARKAVVR